MLSPFFDEIKDNFLAVVLTHVVRRSHWSWPGMVRMRALRAEGRCAQQ